MKTYRKDVTDEEVKAYMKPYLEELMRGVVPRVQKEPEAVPRQGVGVRARIIRTAEQRPGPTQTGLRPEPDVTTEERDLLENILAEPNLTVTARANRLGLSAYKMNNLKKSAAQKGLVEQFTVNWGKEHGGNVTLLALSREGFKALGRKPEERPENVSREHWWWQTQIAENFKSQGLKAEIEKSRNGARADVGLTIDGSRERAIEVELTPNNAVSSIVADLKEGGFDKVVSCCKDRMVAREVTRRLEAYEGYESIKERVVVRVLSELRLVKELCGK